jgi:hypothetical protein
MAAVGCGDIYPFGRDRQFRQPAILANDHWNCRLRPALSRPRQIVRAGHPTRPIQTRLCNSGIAVNPATDQCQFAGCTRLVCSQCRNRNRARYQAWMTGLQLAVCDECRARVTKRAAESPAVHQTLACICSDPATLIMCEEHMNTTYSDKCIRAQVELLRRLRLVYIPRQPRRRPVFTVASQRKRREADRAATAARKAAGLKIGSNYSLSWPAHPVPRCQCGNVAVSQVPTPGNQTGADSHARTGAPGEVRSCLGCWYVVGQSTPRQTFSGLSSKTKTDMQRVGNTTGWVIL